jgi:hypothetical protein
VLVAANFLFEPGHSLLVIEYRGVREACQTRALVSLGSSAATLLCSLAHTRIENRTAKSGCATEPTFNLDSEVDL